MPCDQLWQFTVCPVQKWPTNRLQWVYETTFSQDPLQYCEKWSTIHDSVVCLLYDFIIVEEFWPTLLCSFGSLRFVGFVYTQLSYDSIVIRLRLGLCNTLILFPFPPFCCRFFCCGQDHCPAPCPGFSQGLASRQMASVLTLEHFGIRGVHGWLNDCKVSTTTHGSCYEVVSSPFHCFCIFFFFLLLFCSQTLIYALPFS